MPKKDLNREPLQWSDLSKNDRKVAGGVVEHFTGNLGSSMASQSERLHAEADRTEKQSSAKTKRSKAKRLGEMAPHAPKAPVTLTKAANARVRAVEDAATQRRMPGENIPGAGWYGDANTKVRAAAPGVDSHVAAAASSALSPGSKPELERASLAAQVEAHRQGKIDVNDHVIHHLASHGVSVPDALRGRKVGFGELPGHVAAALSLPESRHVAEAHSEGVDWRGINKVSYPDNIAKAHEALAGRTPADQVQDPSSAPKTWSYTHNLAQFQEHTPEFHEYMARAAHLGERIRGEAGAGEHMLDLWGHRSSNEGILSNHGHTAEDSWQRAISIDIKHPQMKAAGDVSLGAKSHPETGETVGRGDTRINGETLYHAWNNEATHRASKMLQTKYGTEFTVPTTLVQETGWTGTRRRVGADSEYNAHLRGEEKATKQATREEKPLKGQGRLF